MKERLGPHLKKVYWFSLQILFEARDVQLNLDMSTTV